MNPKWLLSRRELLGGLSVAAASSLLRGREARAQMMPPAAPKRLVVFFTPNGTIPEAFRPTGTETAWTPSPILEPLARFRSKLLVLWGVHMRSTASGIGDGHQKGMCHMLTATDLMPGPFPGGGGAGPAGYAGGISIDQEIANAVGGGTRFRSLEFGVRCGSATNWSRMCYRGADQPIPPMEDPYAAFTRVFADVTAGAEETRRRLARRQSVLDNAVAEMAELGRRLTPDDRARLEAYQEALRDIERRLQMTAATTCTAPSLGARIDLAAAANYPAVGRLQMDMIVAALRCGLTRVASLQWSRSVGQTQFPWLGFTDRHHDLSHEGDSNLVVRDKITRINRWYAEQFAYLLGALDAVREGDRTMLDNSVVLWCNELGKGNSHTRDNVPWVLAGSGGGYFRTGRYVSYATGQPHNNLLVSIANAMGHPITTFGNARFCTGPLPNLR